MQNPGFGRGFLLPVGPDRGQAEAHRLPAMSRQQLLELVQRAASDAALRRQLRGCNDWTTLLQRAREQGFDVCSADLGALSACDQAGRFMRRSQLAPIRRLP